MMTGTGSFTKGCSGSGMRAEMARLTVARKLGAVTVLAVWKRGESFDAERISWQAASK